MSLRRTDLRLTLPHPARTAVVLGDLGAWRTGLASAGLESVAGVKPPDLAVAPGALAGRAAATGASAVVLEGRGGAGRRELARAGYAVQRLLPLPDLDRPSFVLPLDRGPVARYALTCWRPADTPTKRLRDRLASTLVESGSFPPLRAEQVLGLRSPGAPFPIAAAEALGIPGDAGWFMALGQGDALARVAFYLFAAGEPNPSWVLKLARVPGLEDTFDRDEKGLTLAVESGGIAGAHAPELIGRFEVDGLQASVESAAVGEQLSGLIARDRPRACSAIDGIAAWIVEVGAETRASADLLAPERHRLDQDVLPRWLDRGAGADLVDRLPQLAPVLQHNDLGSWNLIVRPDGGFVAVDWESARRNGLPLWDLLYFLVDVLPLLEGARTPHERVTEALRLVRGESPSSDLLFRWVRTAASAAGVPDNAVGAVATLCWLHHGLSHVPRRDAAEQAEPGGAAALSPIDRFAPLWLADPALGASWSVWRR